MKLSNLIAIFKILIFLKPSTASSPMSSIPAAQKAVFEILNSTTYHKYIRPGLTEERSDKATKIKVNLFIRKIQNINDLKMELTSQMTIRQIWNDSRLIYKTEDPSLEYVTLDESLAEMLWTPDLFQNSETFAFLHTIMKPNSYKRIYPDGKVLWSSRITSTISCPMNFKYFPFDKQMCKITLQSFSETIKDLKIEWDQEILVQFGEKSYSNFGFDLEKFKTGNCEDDENIKESIGTFSCIDLKLYFERQPGIYVTSVYLPCAMIVMLSWISFWLGEGISSRLSLTLTLLLTLATQTQSFNQNMPQVSYIKGIDIWTGICMAFACLSILETSAIAFILQNKNGNRVKDCDKLETEMKSKALLLDKISRFLFPFAFIIFTIVYISLYIRVEDKYPNEVN